MIHRLAETAEGLYEALCNVAQSGVVTRYGILYPVATVDKGTVFHPRKGRLELDAHCSGVSLRAATVAEQHMFHSALEADSLWVVLRTRPGYGSGYATPTTLRVFTSLYGEGSVSQLHQPSNPPDKQVHHPNATDR